MAEVSMNMHSTMLVVLIKHILKVIQWTVTKMIFATSEAIIDLPNDPRGVVKCYWNIFDSRYKHFDMICFSCLFPSAERLRQTGEHILQRTTSILIFP